MADNVLWGPQQASGPTYRATKEISPKVHAAKTILLDANGDPITPANPAVMRLPSSNGPTYFAFGTAYAGYANPTDMLVLKGSASKVIRVAIMTLFVTTTAGALQIVKFYKRSAANTAGTASQPTINNLDSGDPAATAVLDLYSVIPSALGTGVLIGPPQFATTTVTGLAPASFALASALAANAITVNKPVTLRGVAESLAINWNDGAALPAGFSANYHVAWTESDT